MSVRILNYTGKTLVPRERCSINMPALRPMGSVTFKVKAKDSLGTMQLQGAGVAVTFPVVAQRGSYQVEGLPDPEEGVIYLVSCVAYSLLRDTRNDLAILSNPAELSSESLLFDGILVMSD